MIATRQYKGLRAIDLAFAVHMRYGCETIHYLHYFTGNYGLLANVSDIYFLGSEMRMNAREDELM
jgi:hypothetical protein